MRIVIVGGSKFGTATAEQLIEENHEVVVIDRDRAKLERLSETLDCGMIEGDGTRPAVLRDAHTSEDDILIALTNASDDNILAALVGRSVGYARVIPQIISPELLDVCTELDLTDTITPHATVARSICRGLKEKSAMSEIAPLSGALRLKRCVVGAPLEGTSLKALDLPETVRLIAHIRNETETLATGDIPLRQGDEVLLAAHVDTLDTLEAFFEHGNS